MCIQWPEELGLQNLDIKNFDFIQKPVADMEGLVFFLMLC